MSDRLYKTMCSGRSFAYLLLLLMMVGARLATAGGMSDRVVMLRKAAPGVSLTARRVKCLLKMDKDNQRKRCSVLVFFVIYMGFLFPNALASMDGHDFATTRHHLLFVHRPG